ncbi:MAG: hypothetical protein AAF609_00955 [Cyanobacteria bacterium P01_C01_bin.120]
MCIIPALTLLKGTPIKMIWKPLFIEGGRGVWGWQGMRVAESTLKIWVVGSDRGDA